MSARHILLVLVLLAGVGSAVARGGERDGKLEIHWIDVEGGAATLLVTPAGESILVDTGNPGHRDPDRIVKQAAAAGLRRIDHLVITHYHRDHFGGAAVVSELLPIGTVWDNGRFEGQPDDPGKEYYSLKCERRQTIQPGDTLPLKQREGAPEIRIRCLGARQQFVSAVGDVATNDEICAQHRPKERDGSDNANSIVLVLDFGAFRFFDAGDLTWNQEQRLVCPVNLVGKVDVYQVTHHGLDSSNNPVVIRTLEPRVAIMNNGTTKGCLPEVFATLSTQPGLQAVYQVHKNLRPDGATNNVAEERIANREAECQGHPIVLKVAADSRTYEVAIPAHGHAREFETMEKP